MPSPRSPKSPKSAEDEENKQFKYRLDKKEADHQETKVLLGRAEKEIEELKKQVDDKAGKNKKVSGMVKDLSSSLQEEQ